MYIYVYVNMFAYSIMHKLIYTYNRDLVDVLHTYVYSQSCDVYITFICRDRALISIRRDFLLEFMTFMFTYIIVYRCIYIYIFIIP